MQNISVDKRTVQNCDVYIADGLIDDLCVYLRQSFDEGVLLVLYDRHLQDVADTAIRDLKRNGYKIFAQSICSNREDAAGGNKRIIDRIPEYVRYIFAIGAGSVANVAKDIAVRLNIEWSMLLSAPSTDTVLCGKSPKQVFIDKNIIVKCPIECIASGYGIALSSQFSAFERTFDDKILSVGGEDAECFDAKNASVVELALYLLQSSANRRIGSADIMAGILCATAKKKGNKPRLFGEYKFIASTTLTHFYRSFLGALCIDAMPPACLSEQFDKLCALDFEHTQKSVDFFDLSGYFRISYILGEYRMDLLDKISGIDVLSMQRFWRRLYPDAGYWLKSETSASTVLKCMALAGAMSDNLLGYAYASGVMNKF